MNHLIERWQGLSILVAGDPGYDVYHHGHVDRVSPEAPVPVFVEDSLEDRPGLAYNVCQNLAGLGCRPVQCFPPQPWTVKRRFMVGHHQLLRADYDQTRHVATLENVPDLTGISAVVLSDYDKGWLSREFCSTLIEKANYLDIPVVVDPKRDWLKFHDCTVICPNEREAEVWPSEMPGTAVLEKRGAAGIRLWTPELRRRFEDFPATAQTVFDVTGAGDTVVAVVAATLAAGGDLWDAARLANLAAGHVVGRVGTSFCTAAELIELTEDYSDYRDGYNPPRSQG